MLTQKEIEDRLRDRHMHQMPAAEEQIDQRLEERWEDRHKGIEVTFEPPIHRTIMDKLAEKYRGPGRYNVQYLRKRPVVRSGDHYEYDTLKFEPYSQPVHSEL